MSNGKNTHLAIDFGDVRIGLALADANGMAMPYLVIQNNAESTKVITDLVRTEQIKEIIVGWPVSLGGTENKRTEKTNRFISKLQVLTAVPIFRVDERMTSQAAHAKGVSRPVDAVAAADILQTYLDRHASHHPV